MRRRTPRSSRIPRALAALAGAALTGVAAFSLTACGPDGDPGDSSAARPERNGAPGLAGLDHDTLGDFDRDGYDDYATAVTAADVDLRYTPEGRRVVIVPGSEEGLDTARRRVLPGLDGPLLRADLDGDGYTDLAATRDPNPGGPPRPGAARQAVVLHGGPDGLGEPVPVAAEGDFTLVAVADVDGDGHPDLIDRGAGRQDNDPGAEHRPGRIAYGPLDRDGVPARLAGQDWKATAGGVTAGDFDGDRYDDLLFTTTQTGPEEDGGGAAVAPVDAYFRGTPDGPVRAEYPRGLDDDAADGPTVPAAGDVDGDGTTDLLVAGDRRVGYDRHPTAGRLTIVHGAKGGGPGTGRGTLTLDQETPGIPGDSQHGDRFGSGSGTGDVTGDGHPDLVVNSPGEDGRSGRLTLIPGSAEGPDPARATAVDLDTPGVPGERHPSGRDGFGAAFPLLDVDGDRHADVVALSVGYFLDSRPRLLLLPGGPSGLDTRAARSVDAGSVGLDPRRWDLGAGPA
jgi:hypothetical protein